MAAAHLLSLSLFLVMLSGLIHSVWNLFTKKSLNKSVFLWFCQWAAIVVFLPFFILRLDEVHSLPLTGGLIVLLSMALHGGYVLLLAFTYTSGDLSQAYPIMRGTSPLLVPLIGVLLLNESLKVIGWIGVILIVVGIWLVGDLRIKSLFKMTNKTMFLAGCVGIMITGYTVVDKIGLNYLSPIVLNEATNIGNLIALSAIALRSKELKREWKVNWRTIILGGILAPGGYLLFLWALQMAPVSQLAPMREIGTIFGVLLGIFVLGETQGRNRLLASVLITTGIILLAL
jgi:uncharacterized membrane protein